MWHVWIADDCWIVIDFQASRQLDMVPPWRRWHNFEGFDPVIWSKKNCKTAQQNSTGLSFFFSNLLKLAILFQRIEMSKFLSSGPLHDRHCEACIDRDVHFLCDPMPPRSQAQPVSLWKTYFSFAKRVELALFWKHTGDRIVRTPRMGYGDMMMPSEESSINRVVSVWLYKPLDINQPIKVWITADTNKTPSLHGNFSIWTFTLWSKSIFLSKPAENRSPSGALLRQSLNPRTFGEWQTHRPRLS